MTVREEATHEYLRGLLRWLMLFTPAVEMLLVGSVPSRWAAAMVGGGHGYEKLDLDSCNLLVVATLSLILGIWFAWPRFPTWFGRLGLGFFYGVIIALFNGTSGFVGCMVGHSVFG